MERNAYDYSVHRLFALHEYCNPTSPWRVLFVKCAYGVPALVLLLLIEVVPLQDPNDGWRGNGVYWLCAMVSVTVIANAVLLQLRLISPDIALTTRHIVTIAFGAALSCVGMAMLLEKYRMFPVPFTPTAAAPSLSLSLNALTTVALDTKEKLQLRKYTPFAPAQA
ncbi:hypothetical protein FI667_g16891, partial [Globisporangium splendens]